MTTPSIALAVISYRRTEQLARLLASLQRQAPASEDAWTARIVVVDNDAEGSAREVVEASAGPWPVSYAIEPEAGIPFAREHSLDLCQDDDAIVFVDDDEFAPDGWLDRLVTAWQTTGADVVTGPVRGILPAEAPEWARHCDVYTSVGKHATGDQLPHAYTNNTLVSQQVARTVRPGFDPAFRFTGSSDLNYFQKVRRAGFTIVWDDQAVIEEEVPASRVSLPWLAKRAFRSGAGDAISRRLLQPGAKGVATAAAMGFARIGNGVALTIAGVRDPGRRIKGVRRIVSGVGTLAGLAGINYEEYRRPRSSSR